MVVLIGMFATVLILAYFGVQAIRYLAERHEILDIPNERSSHTQSVPRGGGLAIGILTLLGVWLFVMLNPVIEGSSLIAYTIGAVLIVGISWLDDIRSQPNWLRFGIHSFAALLAIYGFGYIQVPSLLYPNSFVARSLGLILTFIWIVGLTNAYNFMDGIDGIAGGQAVLGGLAWAALGWLTGEPFVLILGLLLATSSLGFLLHNWPPARIFMGDVGSAFLGYSFAVLPVIFSSHPGLRARGAGPVFVGILAVWPFVFDSTFTFFRRMRLGENVFSAHRSHLYQRLVIVGYSHRFVTLLYSGLAAVGLLLALIWILPFRNGSVAVAVTLPLLCLSLWSFVINREHRLAGRSHEPTYVDPV